VQDAGEDIERTVDWQPVLRNEIEDLRFACQRQKCDQGNQAARLGMSVLYQRLPLLIDELAIAREDGSLFKLRQKLQRPRLLVLDDWGLTTLTDQSRQDLLEIVDDRVGKLSTAITSQLPVDAWHDYIGNPTIADAILDRLVHSAHRIVLKGESMRKLMAKTDAATTA
jgi:DNA replication protein DnaC